MWVDKSTILCYYLLIMSENKHDPIGPDALDFLAQEPSAEIQALVETYTQQEDDIFKEMMRIGGRDAIENRRTPYAGLWAGRKSGEGVEDLLVPLAGQAVVDLGCGEGSTFRKVLSDIGVSRYIGVDQMMSYGYRPYLEDERVGVVMPLGEDPEDYVEGFLIRTDMLSLVARLPDGFGSFALNGIDDAILEPDTPYTQELVRQIARATAPGGVVVGVTFPGGILDAFQHLPEFHSEVRRDHHLTFQSHTKISHQS